MKPVLMAFAALAAALSGNNLFAADSNSFPVTIHVHAAKPIGPLKPIWRFFGADEPNYATMKNGKKLISELGELRPNEVFFRAHNLLTSGDGTPELKWGSTGVYSEDANGKPVYNWTILDGIFDTYRANHVRPYVEIGFMPKALSTHPEPYEHHWTQTKKLFTGWAYPPKDYDKWAELVFQWAQHAIAKYGKAEVEHWYWEVWNEANIGYWQGKPEEFYRLHDTAIAAVRRALPTARVGGMDSAGGGEALRHFLEHCAHGTNYATGIVGTPLDFVAFHAKGSPAFTDGHLRMGISAELRTMDSSFRIISSFPEYQHTPIVIGECDPDSCAACTGNQVGYRNGTMFSSYTAACFARAYDLAAKYDVNLEGALTWAFEFENQPPFAGLRAIATDGIDLPVLNVFRMFSKLPEQRLAVESDAAASLDDMLKTGVRERPDVSALAALGGNRLCVLVWHYHDDDVTGPDANVEISLDGLPEKLSEARVQQFRIDADHSNAFTVWKNMNSPRTLTPEQFAQLEKAGHLAEMDAPKNFHFDHGKGRLNVVLPRQAVSLFVFEWPATP